MPDIQMQLKIVFTCFVSGMILLTGELFAQQLLSDRSSLRVHPAAGAIDLDGNGVISELELRKAPQSLLGLDSNGDGVLSSDELLPVGGDRVGHAREGRGGQWEVREGPRKGKGGRRGGGPRPEELGESDLDIGEAAIAWYPRMKDGIAEAKRTNRPIIFMAVASQCGGVPGVF